jgi:hypothetical protein
MKQKRIPRSARGEKLGGVPPTQKPDGPADDAEERDAIRAYDSAKAPRETPIPYEQILQRIEDLRK